MCRFFFFNDTATTEIYTLSLHDALPIWVVDAAPAPGEVDLQQRVLDQVLGGVRLAAEQPRRAKQGRRARRREAAEGDRKSTRLNSSHANISDAVFRLQKKPLLPLLLPQP